MAELSFLPRLKDSYRATTSYSYAMMWRIVDVLQVLVVGNKFQNHCDHCHPTNAVPNVTLNFSAYFFLHLFAAHFINIFPGFFFWDLHHSLPSPSFR